MCFELKQKTCRHRSIGGGLTNHEDFNKIDFSEQREKQNKQMLTHANNQTIENYSCNRASDCLKHV